jgi:hypothetical protein
VSDGTLSLVLHTHLPYVEGFDRWPFGEEWLFEAMASCYLPLLDVLGGGAPLTVSLTPVLADQLGAPGVPERFAAFVQDVRRETHRRDLAALDAELRPALEHSLAQYEAALARLRALGGDLLGALAPHVSWTSAATTRSSASRARQASSATCGPLQVVRSRGLPQLVTGSSRGAGTAGWRRTASSSGASSRPCAGASSSTASSHHGPSCHQWPSSSVSTAQTASPPPATRSRTRATKSRASARAASRARAGS